MRHARLVLERRRLLPRERPRGSAEPRALLRLLVLERRELLLVPRAELFALLPLRRAQPLLRLRVQAVGELREAEVHAPQEFEGGGGVEVPPVGRREGRDEPRVRLARRAVHRVDPVNLRHVLVENPPARLRARDALPLTHEAHRLVKARVLHRHAETRAVRLAAARAPLAPLAALGALHGESVELGDFLGVALGGRQPLRRPRRHGFHRVPPEPDGHLRAVRRPEKLRSSGASAPPAKHRVPLPPHVLVARGVDDRLARPLGGGGPRAAASRRPRPRLVDRAKTPRVRPPARRRRRLREVRGSSSSPSSRRITPWSAERLREAVVPRRHRPDPAPPRVAEPRRLRRDFRPRHRRGARSVVGEALVPPEMYRRENLVPRQRRSRSHSRPGTRSTAASVGDVVEHLQAHRRRSRHSSASAPSTTARRQRRAGSGPGPRTRRRRRPERSVASACGPRWNPAARVGTRRGTRARGLAPRAPPRRRRRPSSRRGRAPPRRVPPPGAPYASKRASATSGAAASAGGSDRTYTSRTWRHPLRRRVSASRARESRALSAARPVRQREVVPDERLAPRPLVLERAEPHRERVRTQEAVDAVRLDVAARLESGARAPAPRGSPAPSPDPNPDGARAWP